MAVKLEDNNDEFVYQTQLWTNLATRTNETQTQASINWQLACRLIVNSQFAYLIKASISTSTSTSKCLRWRSSIWWWWWWLEEKERKKVFPLEQRQLAISKQVELRKRGWTMAHNWSSNIKTTTSTSTKKKTCTWIKSVDLANRQTGSGCWKEALRCVYAISFLL